MGTDRISVLAELDEDFIDPVDEERYGSTPAGGHLFTSSMVWALSECMTNPQGSPEDQAKYFLHKLEKLGVSKEAASRACDALDLVKGGVDIGRMLEKYTPAQ